MLFLTNLSARACGFYNKEVERDREAEAKEARKWESGKEDGVYECKRGK